MKINDRLRREIARQQKYLDKLPADYEFPLFNVRQAIESQRASGYRSTAAAAREIIDNAVEGGARRVEVVFNEKKSGKRTVVSDIAFIDDGSGMREEMARYALTWGGGTHFEDEDGGFIGRFGFGLPNASINQTRRVEVYTRTPRGGSWRRTHLDINEFASFGTQSVPPEEEAELPDFVQRYLDKDRWKLRHGTVVVWVAPDRLTYRTPANLIDHLLADFGTGYRYLLSTDLEDEEDAERILLRVAGKVVEPIDPLFLLPYARYYVPAEEGGVELIRQWVIPVQQYTDPERGDLRLRAVDDAEEDSEAADDVVDGTIQVRVVRFPYGFAGSEATASPEAKARLEIRKSTRGMSFVRARREIQVLDQFPRSAHAKRSGMGDWPLLQSYAYHWGVEVVFQPELDRAFGITNDKQGVRPIEDFWRVLHAEEVDLVVKAENAWQVKTRREENEKRRAQPASGPSIAERAAARTDQVRAQRPRTPTRYQVAAQAALNSAAKQQAKREKRPVAEVRAEMEREQKKRPYRFEYFSAEHAPFFEPLWLGGQIVIRLNERHPFYEVIYKRLLETPATRKAKEGLDLLLIALAKAEVTADDDEMADWYEGQRKAQWTPFLEMALKQLDRQLDPSAEEAEAEAAEMSGEAA